MLNNGNKKAESNEIFKVINLAYWISTVDRNTRLDIHMHAWLVENRTPYTHIPTLSALF